MKIILPAGEIPLESKVSKIGGTKQYILKGDLRFHNKDGKREFLLKPSDDVRYLCGDAGDIMAVYCLTELMWYCEYEELKYYLYDKYEADHK